MVSKISAQGYRRVLIFQSGRLMLYFRWKMWWHFYPRCADKNQTSISQLLIHCALTSQADGKKMPGETEFISREGAHIKKHCLTRSVCRNPFLITILLRRVRSLQVTKQWAWGLEEEMLYINERNIEFSANAFRLSIHCRASYSDSPPPTRKSYLCIFISFLPVFWGMLNMLC